LVTIEKVTTSIPFILLSALTQSLTPDAIPMHSHPSIDSSALLITTDASFANSSFKFSCSFNDQIRNLFIYQFLQHNSRFFIDPQLPFYEIVVDFLESKTLEIGDSTSQFYITHKSSIPSSNHSISKSIIFKDLFPIFLVYETDTGDSSQICPSIEGSSFLFIVSIVGIISVILAVRYYQSRIIRTGFWIIDKDMRYLFGHRIEFHSGLTEHFFFDLIRASFQFGTPQIMTSRCTRKSDCFEFEHYISVPIIQSAALVWAFSTKYSGKLSDCFDFSVDAAPYHVSNERVETGGLYDVLYTLFV
jgi:hypothetical protein